MASAIAGLFDDFPFMAPDDHYVLARRAFVVSDVNTEVGVDAAVMRGEALLEIYAKNGTTRNEVDAALSRAAAESV